MQEKEQLLRELRSASAFDDEQLNSAATRAQQLEYDLQLAIDSKHLAESERFGFKRFKAFKIISDLFCWFLLIDTGFCFK